MVAIRHRERGRRMGIIRDMQRAHATQAAAQQRATTAATQQRDSRRLYVEARTADAAAANADVRARLSDLDTLLLSTLDVDDHIDLDRFKKPVEVPPFDPGPLGRPLPEPSWESYAPPSPRGMGKILGGDRLHQQQTAAARQAYQAAR